MLLTVCYLQEHQLDGVNAIVYSFFGIIVIENLLILQPPLRQNDMQYCIPLLNLEQQKIEKYAQCRLIHQNQSQQEVKIEVELTPWFAIAKVIVED